MEFSRVSAGAQEISGRNPNQPAAVWLAMLLDGAAVLSDGEADSPVGPGDIIYGPTGVAAALRFKTRFRLLFITVPRLALDHRLVKPSALRVGRLAAAEAMTQIFSSLLRALAERLDDLTADQLRPVELAVTEFLAAALVDEPAQTRRATGAREAHLHRIRQTIETLLGAPDLTLGHVAEAEGVSPRYLQKLFASAGESFTHYVRLRRLERCRLDMINPLYADSSLSSICFRWGFNGSAHFSRAFREQYGESPRGYRKAAR
jgi:AraC-like DNA-binding protein